MVDEIITSNTDGFFKIDLIKVIQKNKVFYVGKVPASVLLERYTAEPAEYDIEKSATLAKTFADDIDYSQFRLDIERKVSEIAGKNFERKLEKSRVSEIAEYLKNDEYSIFPNTVIVTCDLLNEIIETEEGVKFEDMEEYTRNGQENLSYLEENINEVGNSALFVPHNRNALLVIDGQHRLKGLEKAGSEITDHYDVLVSFIVGFDRAVVAKLFTTINYTQKPVNKSLLYQLSGEFSHELDEITFMHEVVRVLNEVAHSPFFKRVKMLGTTDPSLSREIREKMTISQAFLIDYLKRGVDSDAKTGLYPPIFLAYYKKENCQIEIVRFIINYFRAVKQLNEGSWENPNGSIICKTIGIGAFIRVMFMMFVKMFTEDFQGDFEKIKLVTIENLINKLTGIEQIDFSVDGKYGKVASGGTLNKLQAEIISKMEYFKASDYTAFLDEYKSHYLKTFRESLKNI
jgi:DGQHR domain-containing protein